MNNGVVRDRDNNFSRHQTFKDGVTIEGGLTVDITGGSNAEETADFTAEVGKVYVVDTSSTAVTATLPASPAALEEVTFMDGAKTFNSNALTVNMNGKKLDGATVPTKVHTTKGGAFKYIYRNATYGWLLKAFIFMLFALNIHAGDFTYEMNSWEQDSGLSIGTDKLKPRTAGSLLSIADSAGTTVATITTSAMTITTASIGTLSLTTALTVSNGGTGLSTLAAGRIPYGAGTNPLASDSKLTWNSTGYWGLGLNAATPKARISVENYLGLDANMNQSFYLMNASLSSGSYKYMSAGYAANFVFNHAGASAGRLDYQVSAASGPADAELTLGTKFSVLPNGNFGIGTIAPASILHIGSNDSNSTALTIASQYQSSGFSGSSIINFRQGTVDRFRSRLEQKSTQSHAYNLIFERINSTGTGYDNFLQLGNNWNMPFVGINNDNPLRRLDILDTTGAQARLSYTAGSAYADFTVNAGGDLAITPSGAKTTFTTVAISGDYLASTGAAGITTDVTADGIVFRFSNGLLTAINP